jgi:ribonuclease VapC
MMLVLDTSVLVAVLLKEEGYVHFLDKILNADKCFISTASVLEATLVMRAKKHDAGVRELEILLLEIHCQSVAFDAIQQAFACHASLYFGRGTKANLNFGDCFSYALARALKLPLLFKGNDFVHTDIGTIEAA